MYIECTSGYLQSILGCVHPAINESNTVNMYSTTDKAGHPNNKFLRFSCIKGSVPVTIYTKWLCVFD